ncbi:tetratricopeptide repeat protein [Actinoplanes auranticolor]|uniref:tetratricopeptide repeat protein n=1 Tax=Actinoplanes auranticolor TaxID=47988 RepID=UPI001BB36587|nr:hypothetical protein [Actinoplanes auranticolor]
MYEAVRAALPEWWLVHPGDAAAVRTTAHDPPARTVVWLVELQRYLNQPGGLPAATMRSLLAAGVAVVGTLWPDEYGPRTALREPGPDDRYAEDRELLGLARVVELTTFSPAERRRAEHLAADDGRIRAALKANDAGVTEVLAAGPELVKWWLADSVKPGPSYGRAVITAALDARRVGASAPLTVEYLNAAAPAYLSSALQATAPYDWFEQAIKYATTPLHGATSCLTPQAAGMGQVGGYITADYLYQHAQHLRRAVELPDLVWQALADHHHLDDSLWLGYNAERRAQPGHAILFYRQAADAGDQFAVGWLVGVLVNRGCVDEAIAVLRQRAVAGDQEAAHRLVVLLAEHGRVDEAIALLQQRADAGDEFAADGLVGLRVKHGRVDEAIAVLRLRADAGNERAADRLVGLLAEHGRVDEAIALLRQRADAGNERAADRLVRLLVKHRRVDEAIALLRQRADAGNERAADRLVGLLAEHGRVDELIALLEQQRANGGDQSATDQLPDC